MTLNDLVLLMNANEPLMIRRIGQRWWTETTPDQIVNDLDEKYLTATVLEIWVSYNLYNATMIELA